MEIKEKTLEKIKLLQLCSGMKGVKASEIANKIDDKILELKAKPAFPVNLSINEIAAHSTPSFNDATLAHGLLKVDVGIHVDGYVADTAFSLDLENSQENKKLIQASEGALKVAIEKTRVGAPLNEIGKAIEQSITSLGFQPIINLSGHSLAQYELHAGITIPNHSNSPSTPIKEGAYAIEPFATSGAGKVIDGKHSGIYLLEKEVAVRDSFAREVLQFIKEEYKSLPFCSRWLHKKFGSRALIALKRLEDARILHHYSQLIEKDRKPVAQTEDTIILTKKEIIVTT